MSNGIEIKNLPSATTIKQNDTMTIVQDKQNKQLSLDVFANESDLATLSVLENRCDEVKAKIEVDEYSAEITTSQSMSKIGSDDSGVDLHENVLDGAFESCVLKGKTKYIDNDTQEILDTFQDGRNLSLIDVKSPILSNVGKNLVDSSKIKKWMDKDTHFEYPDWIRVKPNTRYITNLEMGCWELFNANKKKIGENFGPEASPNIRSKLMPSDCYYVKARCWGGNTDTDNGLEYYQKNFVLCEGAVITSQEPYKSNTTTFDQKDGKTIVLRSLPDGTCDTLNVETGEYVQKIGEVVLDGSWGVPSQEVNGYFISYYGLNDVKKENGGNVYCDKFASHGQIWAGGREGVSTFSNSTIWLSISSSKLETPDINGMKKWLSQNPTTVQYELATPIVSTIDVQGFPHAYKNGHIQLSSGSIEPSLTPTVTYKVPVSRMGQIASNTKSNLRQSIKLDQLEVLVYQSLINSEYENLLVQNSAESAASFRNLSVNDPKDGLYYMLKHLIEENQPVQNMLDKINLFYLYGLLSDEHYFDLLLGGEVDVY